MDENLEQIIATVGVIVLLSLVIYGFGSYIYNQHTKKVKQRQNDKNKKRRSAFNEYQVHFTEEIRDDVLSVNTCKILTLRQPVAHYKNIYGNVGYLELWIKYHDSAQKFPFIYANYIKNIAAYNSIIGTHIDTTNAMFESIEDIYQLKLINKDTKTYVVLELK